MEIKKISDEELEIVNTKTLRKDVLLEDKRILEENLAAVNEKLALFEEPKSI